MKTLITAKEAKTLSGQNKPSLSEHMINVINDAVKEACLGGKTQCTLTIKTYPVCEYIAKALAEYGYECHVGGLGHSGWALLITW